MEIRQGRQGQRVGLVGATSWLRGRTAIRNNHVAVVLAGTPVIAVFTAQALSISLICLGTIVMVTYSFRLIDAICDRWEERRRQGTEQHD